MEQRSQALAGKHAAVTGGAANTVTWLCLPGSEAIAGSRSRLPAAK